MGKLGSMGYQISNYLTVNGLQRASGPVLNHQTVTFIRHVLKQTIWLQLSLSSQKNMTRKSMPSLRFEPGSPRPHPKLFDDLDRLAMEPALTSNGISNNFL